MKHAVIIRKDGLTTIEMEDGVPMVKGGGPDAARFQRYIERSVEWPVAPQEVWGQAIQPDYVTRPPENDMELMSRVLQLAEDFDLKVKIIEE